MDDKEIKILSLLQLGYNIEKILKEMNIDEEILADIIIQLDSNGFIDIKNNVWILTQEGKNILKEIRESLKNLKIEYLYGKIIKDEFLKKKKELESTIIIEKSKQDIDNDNNKEKNIICYQCEKENKIGSRYCYQCGASLCDT